MFVECVGGSAPAGLTMIVFTKSMYLQDGPWDLGPVDSSLESPQNYALFQAISNRPWL